MWTDATRAHHARAGLALPSDLTDDEWAVLKPFLPPPSFVGRPRKWPAADCRGDPLPAARGPAVANAAALLCAGLGGAQHVIGKGQIEERPKFGAGPIGMGHVALHPGKRELDALRGSGLHACPDRKAKQFAGSRMLLSG